jgi:hypothetical protein
MPQVEFEPTIPVFEWAKTFHALDGPDTVMGGWCATVGKKKKKCQGCRMEGDLRRLDSHHEI